MGKKKGLEAPDLGAKSWTHRLIIALWFTGLAMAATLLLAIALPLPSDTHALATVVYDRFGRQFATLSADNREPIELAEMPLFLRQAVIATEDAGFYRHGGVSFRGILRAAWRDLTHRRVMEGASTITQQLARTIYLNTNRTLTRKLAEVFYACKIELRRSKDEILRDYLNEVYWGEGTYGVQAAAQLYFGRDPGELNRAEQAMMAGLLQAPAPYSPWRHPETARRRLEQVIARMRVCGYLDAADAAEVLREPLRAREPLRSRRPAPYFLAYIQRFLAGILPEEGAGLYRAGLQVQTTIDPGWQEAAEKALTRLEAYGTEGPQGCLVALDPSSGAIRALVGGKDFSLSQFDRATQARRQPGSAFKPVVYADALEHGYTLATLRDCQPRQFQLGQDVYLPVESHPFAESQLNLRSALAYSSNVVAVSLGAELGPSEVADFAKRLGISSTLRPYLSLPLGTSEITPLELAAVYAAFANGGSRVPPFAVASVRTREGRVLYRNKALPERVLKSSTSYLLTQALMDVFGPGGTAAGLNPGRPAAGKTGTSDANRDAWFAGYTPDLVAVVQVGYDRGNKALPGSGGSLAAPIWAEFARRSLSGEPAREFVAPLEVRSIAVCAETGDLPGPTCPVRLEYFAYGTEPGTICAKHRQVELVVCKRSHLLPGAHCRELETVAFSPGEEPTEVCDLCRGSILDWLDRIFGRSRRNPGRAPRTDRGPVAQP